MRHPHPKSFRRQATLLRNQFLQDGGLPFTDVLTEGVITEALAAVGVWLDRIFTPLVTLWVFLGQVFSADHSCRAARGQDPCSARTGAYCRARERLPEAFFSTAACSAGRALDAKAKPGWRWKGRRVYLFDGTTVTMAQRARPAVAQVDDADARAAVQDAGGGAKGGVAHVLACNLVRTVMAQAAAEHDAEPRSISFKGAMQTLEAFEPLLARGPRGTPPAGGPCTRTCSTRSPPIGSPTGPTGSSRA